MLYIVATPIGNYADITDRARQCLALCDLVIGEETRVASTLLKKIGLEQKEIYELNEHTAEKDIRELVELCETKNVALVSDCGTPGFSDPGPALVRLCRQKKIAMTTLPGASSLMALLSLSSQPIREFVFFGFLPADKMKRSSKIQELKKELRSWIIMDTPYRLTAVLEDIVALMPEARALLAMNITQESEKILEGSMSYLLAQVRDTKAEFMLLKY
jgi:16S rRNA (cytidine1402-2'-O)-methyltransferase